MLNKYTRCHILLILFLGGVTSGEAVQMKPFAIDWRDNADSLVDLSFLLDAPAGKNGFIRISDGHLAKPNGERFRIWGVNVTAASCFPTKESAPVVAQHLARFGINCVRFHFLDSNWSASLFVEGRPDTQALDPKQLDRLDFFVAELKKRGIYTNLLFLKKEQISLQMVFQQNKYLKYERRQELEDQRKILLYQI